MFLSVHLNKKKRRKKKKPKAGNYVDKGSQKEDFEINLSLYFEWGCSIMWQCFMC